MSASLKDFMRRWVINTVAVLIATHVVNGISFARGDWMTLLLATLVLGLLNTFVRPILLVLSLPLVILSLGLFTIVINAFLLFLVGELFKSFYVDSFGAALLGALIISIVSILLNSLTGTRDAHVKIRYRRRRGSRSRRNPPNGPGGGPVIDV